MMPQLKDTELTEKTEKEIDTAGSTDGTSFGTRLVLTLSLKERDTFTTQNRTLAATAAELSMGADFSSKTGFKMQPSLEKLISTVKKPTSGTNKDFNQTSTSKLLLRIPRIESNSKPTKAPTIK